MNNLRELSMNIMFVTNAVDIDVMFSTIKELYNRFTQNDILEKFKTYSEYVEHEENRMKSESNECGYTVVAPFTIIDLRSDEDVSLLHCGDYNRGTKFNDLNKNIYVLDNIYELYGCLFPELSIEDLENTTNIEHIVKKIGGNIVVLSNRNSLPNEVRKELKRISCRSFDPFRD